MKIFVSSAVGVTLTAFSAVFAFAKANPMEFPVSNIVEAETIAKLPEVTIKTEAGLRVVEPTVRPTAVPQPTIIPSQPTPTAAPAETTSEPKKTAASSEEPKYKEEPVAQHEEKENKDQKKQKHHKSVLGLGLRLKLSL